MTIDDTDPFWRAIAQGIFECLKDKGYFATLHTSWGLAENSHEYGPSTVKSSPSGADIHVKHNTIRRFARIVLTVSQLDVTVVTYEGDISYAFQYEDPEMLWQLEKCLEAHDLRPPPECRHEINLNQPFATELSNERTKTSHPSCRTTQTGENPNRTSRRTQNGR